jgi:hypothetical protein
VRQVHTPVVAERQRSLVHDSQHQLPQRVRRLLDFVKQQKTQLQFLGVMLGEFFLSDERVRLTVSQVAWRRADQFGDFVRVLEFRAVHLDHRARVSKQDFRCRLHNPRLA